jgi:sulfite reductase beta subunit-like hemoprotein
MAHKKEIKQKIAHQIKTYCQKSGLFNITLKLSSCDNLCGNIKKLVGAS